MRADSIRFSRARAERTIAATRVAVAAFTLYAIWLDPSEPSRFTALTYGLHIGYTIYAVLLAAIMWRRPSTGWPAASSSDTVANS